MASRLTPVSASLVCDDPRLIGAAEQLLGGPVIPECPEGVLYFSRRTRPEPGPPPRQRRSQPCGGEDRGEQAPGRQRRDHHDWWS
jgi:hypothetical protein